jgi:glycosyltransferase involved in cell wall biosynthesis
MLVEAWARVRPRGWRLAIAGPDEAAHQAQVARAVEAHGLDDVVSFAGPLYGAGKESALFDADLLVLPSHSESFGMVVAEALAHGVPVLTTTGTPWSELPQRGCGWWVAPTIDGLSEGLRAATSCEGGMLRQMGCRGRDWVTKEFGWKRVTHQFLSIYEELLAGQTRTRISGLDPCI